MSIISAWDLFSAVKKAGAGPWPTMSEWHLPTWRHYSQNCHLVQILIIHITLPFQLKGQGSLLHVGFPEYLMLCIYLVNLNSQGCPYAQPLAFCRIKYFISCISCTTEWNMPWYDRQIDWTSTLFLTLKCSIIIVLVLNIPVRGTAKFNIWTERRRRGTPSWRGRGLWAGRAARGGNRCRYWNQSKLFTEMFK